MIRVHAGVHHADANSFPGSPAMGEIRVDRSGAVLHGRVGVVVGHAEPQEHLIRLGGLHERVGGQTLQHVVRTAFDLDGDPGRQAVLANPLVQILPVSAASPSTLSTVRLMWNAAPMDGMASGRSRAFHQCSTQPGRSSGTSVMPRRARERALRTVAGSRSSLPRDI